MKTLLILLLSIVAGFGTVFTLLQITDLPNRESNGFDRRIIRESTTLLASFEEPTLRRIVGHYGERLYFSTNDPHKLITTNFDLSNRREIVLAPIDSAEQPTGNLFTYNVDTTGINLLSNMRKTAFHYPHDPACRPYRYRVSTTFIKGVALSGHSAIFLKQSDRSDTLLLYKSGAFSQSVQGPPVMGSGRFADGHLRYSRETATIAYVHLYHNQVLILDTNLNLRHTFRTIDTLSYRGNRRKLENNPPQVTNLRSFTAGSLLFICSALKADNEPRALYAEHIPVDIYHIATGEYYFTFYLPLYGNKLVKSLHALPGNRLAVLYHGNHAAVYHISLPPVNK